MPAKPSIKENNRLRKQRVNVWLKRAHASNDIAAVNFVLYWIAFEAAFVANVDKNHDGEGLMKEFIKRVTRMDKKKFANTLTTHHKHAVKLMELRVTHRGFWEKGDLNEWQEEFCRELEDFNRGKDPIAKICTVFERLRVVRNQIFHGGSSMHLSLGREQVEHGLELLKAFVPQFGKTMKKSMGKSPPGNWYPVPFPRVGKGSPPFWKKE